MNNFLPHFKKLQNILSSEQFTIYKNMTKNNFVKLADCTSVIKTLKITDSVFVFAYKQKVIKIIFDNPNKFKNELYYSHLLYDQEIVSKASNEGCILILPNYGKTLGNLTKVRSLTKLISELETNLFEQQILEENLILQIIRLHSEYIVHNDIKPSNIIVNTNYVENKLKYILIDFGLTSKYNTYLDNHNLAIGTSGYRPSKNWRNIFDKLISENKFDKNEILLYIFLKDWYAFSKTVNQYGINSNIHEHFKNFKLFEIIKEIKFLLSKHKIELTKIPFYLQMI